MRPNPLLLLLAALLAVSGCAPEDPTLPLVPPDLAAVAGDVPAADSTTDDDDLVCEWGPVEGQDGVWELVCHREEDTGDSECRCWYLVTYHCRGLDCTKLDEDFLGCDPDCGSPHNCTQDQLDIDAEYDDESLYNPPRRAKTHFTCADFDDGDITRGTGTHGHDAGFIHPTYRANRSRLLSCCPGIALKINSDWRCPRGNANLPTPGAIGSWHMEGNGGDFAKSNGTALTKEEYAAIRKFAIDELNVNADGISNWGTSGSFTYTRWIHIDWRPETK